MESTVADIGAVFGALADPLRRRILAELRAGDATVGELAESIGADAKWTTIVDQLNESLHEDAVKRQTGL